MTTLEISQKFGVPTPETCKELDFKGETVFCWCFDELEGWYLAMPSFYHKQFDISCHILSINEAGFSESIDPISVECFGIDNHSTVIPAPQMHEIAPLLPNEDKYTGACIILNGNYLACEHAEYEKCVTIYKYMNVMTENHHYAEAYAQLYLKLKKENLL